MVEEYSRFSLPLKQTSFPSVNSLNVNMSAGARVHYLIRLHVSAGEIFDAVHEAVLRHLVVRPQKLFKLKHKRTLCHTGGTESYKIISFNLFPQWPHEVDKMFLSNVIQEEKSWIIIKSSAETFGSFFNWCDFYQ